MPGQIKHNWMNPQADDPLAGIDFVGPSQWNDGHFFNGFPELDANNSFVGVNTFPTPLAGDNTTRVATTAFVQSTVVFGDAPSDATSYGRLSGTWVRVLATSGDILDGGNF